MTEQEKCLDSKLLNVHLADMKFVHEQMHARMAIVSRLIALSMAFYLAILPLFISYKDAISNNNSFYWLFVLALFPFFIIGMLIAREDNLMISHDAYYVKHLRPAILELVGEDPSVSKSLTFLGKMNDHKVGAIAAFASVFRYTFPLLGIFTIGVTAWNTVQSNNYRFLITTFVIIFFGLILFVLYEINKKYKTVYENFK